MDVIVFSTRAYDREFLDAANAREAHPHAFRYVEASLTAQTVALSEGATAVCGFVNDRFSSDVLERLAVLGARLVVLRSAGFNHVDLEAAEKLGIAVARVPAYSPEAIAEHTIALILSLNRKIHRAYVRVREGNFSLDGLLGFNLGQRTVGVIGTGRIGTATARILKAFGCRVLAYDPVESRELSAIGVDPVDLETLLAGADIISIHCPLTPQTHHLVDAAAIAGMRRGVMIINTSRGAVVDTRAVIKGLKSGKIGALGLDVYEEEGDLFFRDLSEQMLQDDVFARLLTFPNVLITGHQGFFTHEALEEIARSTIENLTSFEADGRARFQIGTELLA